MADTTRIGGIRVDLGLSTAQFEKGIKSAKKEAAGLGASLKSSLGGITKEFGLGLVGGVGGVTGIVAAAKAAASAVAQIGDRARQAGLSAGDFQKIAYVAQQNRIEVEDLTSGIREMQLRMDEFVVSAGKSGSAAEALGRLGYTADEIRDKLKNPLDLLIEITGKIEHLDKAAQIRLFDEIFGGDGERMIRILDMGERGIREMTAEAERLGLVLSDDVIESAAELDRQFNKVATTVGTALKTAIVEASAALVRFVDEFNAFEDRATSSLKTRFSELQTRRSQLTFGEQPGAIEGGLLKLLGKDAETELKAIDDEMAQIAAELKQRALPKLRQELLQQTAGSAPYTPPATTGSGKAPKDTFKPDRDAFAQMLGVTEEYIEAQRLANDQLEHFGDLAVDAGNSLVNALADGKLEGQELLGIISNIVQQLLRMPGLTGLLGGLFGGGSSFGTAGGFASMLGIPGYANGTRNHPGGLAVVGERGPELLNLPRGSQVIPNVRVPSVAGLRGGGGGGQQGVHVTVGWSRTADGNLKPFVESVSRSQAQQVTANGLKAYDAGKQRQQMTSG